MLYRPVWSQDATYGIGDRSLITPARAIRTLLTITVIAGCLGQTCAPSLPASDELSSYLSGESPQAGLAYGTAEEALEFLTADEAAVYIETNKSVLQTDASDEIVAAWTPTTDPCRNAVLRQWQSAPIDPQSDTFMVEFDAKPLGGKIDGLIGLSQFAGTRFTAYATLVRFSVSGTMDVRNGKSYQAAVTLRYTAGDVYHIRQVVNVPASKYSVYVTPQGGSEQLLAENYSFRYEQAGVPQLASWGLYAQSSGLEVCNFSLKRLTIQASPSSGAAPLDVQFTAMVGGAAVSAADLPPGATLSWDYGDGTTPGSGMQVSHSYSTAGSYRVLLTVVLAGGLSTLPGGEMTIDVSPAVLPTAATPTISPNGGSFTGSVVVTLACTTQGASMRYTTDGSDPTTSSTQYIGPLTLTSSTTLKARGFAPGYTESAVASAAFTAAPLQPAATPTINPNSGSALPVQIVMSCATTGAVIRWTLDGSDPTAASIRYTTPITLTVPRTIKARAFASGYSNSAVAVASFWKNTAFTPQIGTFTAEFDATPGSANIDGVIGLSAAAGSTFSNYAAIVRFNPAKTIDVRNGSTYAAAATVNYFAGTVYHFRLVIDVPAHRYSVYVTPGGGAEQLLASNYAFRTEQNTVTQLANWGFTADTGSIQVSNFTLGGAAPTAAAPTITPNGGTYTGSVQVTLACATPGAVIRYTTNGADPTATSTQYTTPFTLTSSAPVKARASAAGYSDSTVAAATFTINSMPTVAEPTITPNGGSFSSAVQVTLASATPGAVIRYTINGAEPTSNSTAYNAPFTLTASATVKAKAFATGYSDSAVATAAFTESSDQTASSISQDGITWTFDRPCQVGRFVNGDWWVIGPVTIRSITRPHNINGRDGSMVNPKGETAHGYDDRIAGYAATKDVSRALPFILQPDQSLVSTTSWEIGETGCPEVRSLGPRPILRQGAVLTCLAALPPVGSFRPPYAGDQKLLHLSTTLRRELLPRLVGVPSTPSMSSVESNFERVWIDNVVDYPGQDYLHPQENMPWYGREMSGEIGDASLMLLLDRSDKETLLVRFVQLGIDLYGIAQSGGYWAPNGGIATGRKFPILFAGLMLNHSGMLGIGTSVMFQEDAQTFYIQETSPGVINYGYGGYTQADVGLPEYGIRHATIPSMDDKTWNCATCYRQINGTCMVGPVLAARILGLRTLWAHQARFDYQDRYMNTEIGSLRSWSEFAEQMWDRHRSSH